MRITLKVAFVAAVSLLIFSCMAQTKEGGPTLPANVKTYSKSELYQKGQFVYYSGKSSSLRSEIVQSASGGIYQATTRIIGKDPILFSISSTAPLNPWKASSLEEATIALSRVSTTAPSWESEKVYIGGDIVKASDNKHYKALWWNQSNNPTTAANQNGGGNWGPWKYLTDEQAKKELQGEAGTSSGTGSSGNNTDLGNTGTETTPPPSAGDTSNTTITGNIDSAVAKKYDWKANLVYLENNVCIYGDNYYRAKWWTQGDTPVANPKVAWETPWQKITESVFKQLAGGNTPPQNQPANDNTDAGIPPSGNTSGTTTGGSGNTGGGGSSSEWPSGANSKIVSQGYLQEWDFNSAPAKIKTALNNKSVFAKLDGTSAVTLFSGKIDATKWNALFGNRGTEGTEYYKYQNFIDALKIIGKYAFVVEYQSKGSYSKKWYVLYKANGSSDAKLRLIFEEDNYFSPGNGGYYEVVDYAAFGTEGSDNDKIRAIAGFLAHCSHETSGSWATASGYNFTSSAFPGITFPTDIVSSGGELNGMLAWSLYFNEEVAYRNLGGAHYVAAYNTSFPPYLGKTADNKDASYHGRGAFQLSWNYNYGLASAIFFGDARILLKNPQYVVAGVPTSAMVSPNWNPNSGNTIQGGTMAFLSSLMFWLTPQAPKPSQQDTMILNRADGKYIAGTAKLTADASRGTPGFGWTINIMNGGFEAGKSWETTKSNYDSKVRRRVLHYQFFVKALGGNYTDEVLDTSGKYSY